MLMKFISDLKKNKITHIIVPFGKAPPTIGLRQTAEDTNLQVFNAIEKGKGDKYFLICFLVHEFLFLRFYN